MLKMLSAGALAWACVMGAHLASASSSPAIDPDASPQTLIDKYRGVVGKHCVTCHSARLKTGNLVLEGLDLAHVPANAQIWEKVVKKVGMGLMPPAGLPRPDAATQEAFRSWLETTLDRAGSAAPNPGRSTTRRLNRVEYTNAIRDLLALQVDGEALLPPDASSNGFDNIADALSVSPALMDRYLLAAQKISRIAVGDPQLRPETRTHQLEFRNPVLGGPASEDLPFGSRGGTAVRHYFPVDGEYVIKVALQRGQVLGIRGLDVANQIDLRLDGQLLKRFTVGGQKRLTINEAGLYTEGLLEVRIPVKTGSRLVGVSLGETTWETEGAGPARLPAGSTGFTTPTTANNPLVGRIEMGIDSLEIEGPFNATRGTDSPSRRRMFVCQPPSQRDEDACARKILGHLARRAYRRPLTDSDLRPLLRVYKMGQGEGGFEAGIQWALEAILTNPSFLFRIERDPAAAAPGTVHRIADIELASRLSFFLWSSIPDDELMNAAVAGTLRHPRVLEQQVRRMLLDPRAKALVENFFGQWLLLRNVATVTPNPEAFPDFDDDLRKAFQRETQLFLESQLRDDRSVLELLTANYTFANERLARHYGIPNVYGTHFRRVTHADNRRAGLLGHGSILTVTSYANRTSPVLRGKFLLENVFGVPPPPPPANVPPLAENDGTAKPQTMRERMARHRTNPVCASCHSQMDPLGLALENFDGVGGARATDGGHVIDASGTFPNGAKFDGVVTFRKGLMAYKDAFLDTVIERLLTYALGREVEYYDRPAIRRIVRDAASTEYRWSSLILGVVKSPAFQMRAASAP